MVPPATLAVMEPLVFPLFVGDDCDGIGADEFVGGVCQIK
jgi:hypothetical protein